ncbi:7318_t:CDS:2 [Rhizophagus irregularis]|nr:7318_t:CDS:2 [Rhizophagus irregularis]
MKYKILIEKRRKGIKRESDFERKRDPERIECVTGFQKVLNANPDFEK